MISVVMPVYNSGGYLLESIGSILKQTYTDFELICVDDHSDDGATLAILGELSDKDGRIRLLRNDGSSGAGNARNLGLVAASGDYIAFVDSDDYFEPEYLERNYERILETRADISVCGFEVCDEFLKGTGTIILPHYDLYIKEDHGEEWLLEFALAPWDKMYRSDFLEKNRIRFQNLSSSNDVFLQLAVL